MPHTGPKIHGVSSKYSLGDLVTADCLLPVSSPGASLTWYIIKIIVKTRLGVDKVKPKGWFKYF